ncbi:unnamed protein product [Thelazia callipaeda]|uniref:Uncharacterized protein n=1 Tax=Thelazia callipaeda TaxID=103827 RepID=A0A0N5CT56_THECL|nr:unnamed protein product [Thelazia callipaeda]
MLVYTAKPLIRDLSEKLPEKSSKPGEESDIQQFPKTFGSRLRTSYTKLVDLPPPPLFDPKLLQGIYKINNKFIAKIK